MTTSPTDDLTVNHQWTSNHDALLLSPVSPAYHWKLFEQEVKIWPILEYSLMLIIPLLLVNLNENATSHEVSLHVFHLHLKGSSHCYTPFYPLTFNLSLTIWKTSSVYLSWAQTGPLLIIYTTRTSSVW